MADTSASALHERLRLRFAEQFGTAEPSAAPVRIARAPGRVNLIGEHTDYNGGLVLPLAIDREVAVAFRRREDRRVRLFAADLGARDEFELDRIERAAPGHWSNYPRGVARMLLDSGRPLAGMDAVIGGTVPPGAGLSSSAALEAASALAFLGAAAPPDASGAPVAPPELATPEGRLELARLCQRAEHEFAGVRCGLMDQLAALAGKAGAALLIDCTSLFLEPIPLALDGLALVVVESGVRRELAATAYNRVRAECESAAEKLLGRPGATLREAEKAIPPAELAGRLAGLTESERQRFLHVQTENFRVLNAVAALCAGDYRAFGRLLTKSHRSLKERFGVSCPELDVLVRLATGVPGVLGARLIGAGFGGSALVLAAESAVARLGATLAERYPRETKREATLHVVRPAAPADYAGG